MDQGSTINYDIEEKQITLGLNLMLQELIKFNDDIILCEQESLANILMNNHEDFK